MFLGLQIEVPSSWSACIKLPSGLKCLLKSHGKWYTFKEKGNKYFFFAVDNMFSTPPRLMSDFIFSTLFSQVPSIKTSWTGQENRQTAWLINQQEGQRTGWQRTIKFDYQTLSPDALYLFPAIHLWCFLNEKPAAGPAPDLSVGESHSRPTLTLINSLQRRQAEPRTLRA